MSTTTPKLTTVTHELIFPLQAQVKEVHASTLVLLPDDSVLAAWFGGTKEGMDDVSIWLSHHVNGQWQTPSIVAKISDEPHWNPVLYVDNDTVHLWFKVGKPIPLWRTYAMTSEDWGKTWTTPRELVPGDKGGRGPVKNKPINLVSGALLAPASIEVGATPSTETGEAKDAAWDAFVDRSEDGGQTWQRSELVPYDHQNTKGEGVIQPTLWESQPGKVHMLLRSGDGWVYRSDSDDDGKTWCQAYPTDLPNNNSGIDVAKLNDGLLALIYNPVGGNWAGRSPITLSFSTDNGRTWTRQLDLQTVEGEFSYPAIIPTPDGLAITYTHDRKSISYWRGVLA
ncbi:MAG: neuraminidase (sialidase) [Phycisphaeraceae bacterium]|nr:neuraminidase (sialidase) [Phycisphaeraceae bacterium]